MVNPLRCFPASVPAAPGDIQTPLWLHLLSKHIKPVPEGKPGFGWVFILVPSASWQCQIRCVYGGGQGGVTVLCLGIGDQMSFNLLSIFLSPYYTQSPSRMLFKSTCGSLYQDYNTRSILLNNSGGTLQQSLACGSVMKLYGGKKGKNTI